MYYVNQIEKCKEMIVQKKVRSFFWEQFLQKKLKNISAFEHYKRKGKNI